MLRAIRNKSWRQHPTRHQLYGHLPPITKTIQVRRTWHAGHCWRSRDELIRDVLLWIPTHGRAKAGRPARTYIQQLCEDTGCCPEDLPRVMNDREEWRERVRDIRAVSTRWWWWWWFHLYKEVLEVLWCRVREAMMIMVMIGFFKNLISQKRSFGIQCSLVYYPGHPFIGGYYPSTRNNFRVYFIPPSVIH